MDVDPRWYETFFDQHWLDAVALTAPDEWTAQQTEFIVEHLELGPGARVLDLAGGHGRLAIPLAERGYRVTLLDLSEPSLARAREAAAARGVEVEIVRADMRDLEGAEEYDAVLNFYSAFGYFESEEEDERVVTAVARALVRGGVFLLDTVNPLRLFRDWQPRGWREVPDGGLMLEEREYDVTGGRSNARWTILYGDGRRAELAHSMRLYTLPEFRRMLDRAGLVLERAWGSVDGSEYTLASNRLIFRARKP